MVGRWRANLPLDSRNRFRRRLILHFLGLGLWGRKQTWFFRHHDPGSNVGDHTKQSEQRAHQPDDPNQGYVKIEVLGESKTNAGNLTPVARSHESPPGHHTGQAFAAVCAKMRIVRNHFAAVVAVHEGSSLVETCTGFWLLAFGSWLLAFGLSPGSWPTSKKQFG